MWIIIMNMTDYIRHCLRVVGKKVYERLNGGKDRKKMDGF